MNKIEQIKNWLNSYLEKSNSEGFILGISGGIDSAVTSTICALTGKKTICLNLPIHQNKFEYERSNQHIKWLKKKFTNVESFEIDLTETFTCIQKNLPDNLVTNLALANTRSRLRMVMLYLFSGSKNLLVVGTGNKVEDFGIGFFTKYGDGGVDISPIADLMKSEVYEIASELGVIDSIIISKPTDGLYDGSPSDEEQIGATYDELEWAMSYDEFDGSYNLSERQIKVLEIYKSFNSKNRHKMEPIPVCKL